MKKILTVPKYKDEVGIGLMIPGHRPGFHVVVEMSRYPPPGLKYRKMTVIGGGYSDTPDGLFDSIMPKIEKYKCHNHIFSYMNDIDRQIIGQVNNRLYHSTLHTIQVLQPDGDKGTILHGLSVIRERTRSTAKSLFLGDKFGLAGLLEEIPQDIKPADSKEHPEISSFAAVVSGLNLHDFVMTRRENMAYSGLKTKTYKKRTGV